MSAGPGPIFIVGAGRMGTALAILAARAGIEVIGCWTRRPAAAARVEAASGIPCNHGPFPDAIGRARTVLLTASDPIVPTLAGALLDGALLRGAAVVLHSGGARAAAEALAPLIDGGSGPIAVGTFHPLVSVADPVQAVDRIGGAFIAVEGDPAARETARQIGAAIGARTFELEGGSMAIYHAAAVLASNHAVALWYGARGLLEQAGLEPDVASEALLALLRSTVENVAELGLPEALTGPVRRGDTATVQRHLAILQQRAPQLHELYRIGSVAAVAAARRTADGPASEALMEAMLEALAPRKPEHH